MQQVVSVYLECMFSLFMSLENNCSVCARVRKSSIVSLSYPLFYRGVLLPLCLFLYGKYMTYHGGSILTVCLVYQLQVLLFGTQGTGANVAVVFVLLSMFVTCVACLWLRIDCF